MPIVKAPLVIAKDQAGNLVYLYEGTEVPASIGSDELDRLAGYFYEEPSDAVEELERPAESGPGSAKSKWHEYAASVGVEVADDAEKEDIIAAVSAAGH